MRSLWLIQRLKHTPADCQQPDRGFDGYFALDYMGAAEYEFGAPLDSLNLIRGRGTATVQQIHLQGPTTHRVVHLVASGEHEARGAQLQAWMADPRCKERTYFPEHFAGTADSYQERVVAWWAFDEGFGWALDAEIADDLATAFNATRPQRSSEPKENAR